MDSHEIPLALVEKFQDLLPVRFGFLRPLQSPARRWSSSAGLCAPLTREIPSTRAISRLLTPCAFSSRIVVRCAWLNMSVSCSGCDLLRRCGAVASACARSDAARLLRCWSSISVAAAPASRRARGSQSPPPSPDRANSSAPVPAGAFSCACRCVLKNSSGSSRMRLRIAARAFAPGGIQLPGLPRIAVMLRRRSRPSAGSPPGFDARHRHQILHRHLRRDLALAHLLLDRFRQQLHQRQPPRHPAHAAIEPARQLLQPVAEALLQLRQQPAYFQRASRVRTKRSERSSSTASASLIGHTTASTVSRPSCSSAAIRL